jgi:hypothetical protein
MPPIPRPNRLLPLLDAIVAITVGLLSSLPLVVGW